MTNLPNKFHNKIIHGDVMETLQALPDNCIDMIYSDPDYGVGINYSGKKFTQRWVNYIDWYIKLTKECMRLLKPTGNLFIINYPKQNAHLRVNYLDAAAYEVHDYVWVYPTNVGHSPRRFTTAHRSILHAVKTKNNNFYKDQVALPYKNPKDNRIKARIAAGHKGRMPYSWFEFNLVKNISKEKTFHACQIPTALFEMLTKAATKTGDSVFILFGGSGSEIVKARAMKRIYLSCEIHPRYYQMIADRLSGNGNIRDKYRLPCAVRNNKNANPKENIPMDE